MSGPLPAPLVPITAPAAWIYGRVVAVRNRRYDRAGATAAVGVPVISVGNLTAGGSGKTPFVAWLAERLVAAGHRPVIAMRGYGAKAGGMSDEQAEYADRLPDVEVVAGPDRHGALTAFLAGRAEIDCVLLDDGFQHRQLARTLDLVLVDASRPTLDDHLLPRGYLREPPAALRRADGVVVTRAAAVDPDLAARIRAVHGRPPLAWSRHTWTAFDVHDGPGASRRAPLDWIAGRRVATVLGVGHPASIRRQLEDAGATIVRDVPVRDHVDYTAAVLARVREAAAGCDAIVTTAKDWVKVRRLIDSSRWPGPVVVPALVLEVFDGADALVGRALAAVRGAA